MSNILLIEPNYRSKFPPLGLLRIASYHKNIGDNVTFTRGCNLELRNLQWDKIYVSSLFTYGLPCTVKTLKFYRNSVNSFKDLIVGGIGVTLMPDYILQNVDCRIVTGPLLQPNILNGEKQAIAKYIPDYEIIDSPFWSYSPRNSYFCRVTTGCIRHCPFCAVPILEPEFRYLQPLQEQISNIVRNYGERQNLVLMDNNILVCDRFDNVITDIQKAGFEQNSKLNNRKRIVDFNQGIDARLINKKIAKLLSTIYVSPIRLAFDYRGIENAYTRAIKLLANQGFINFTNYVMFNYNDTPRDFYYRIRLNALMSKQLGIRVTGFPMKYAPINDVSRRHIAPRWKWRYLRGIQCILLATHGLVSPNLDFFKISFGSSFHEFCEIISMPDRYIIQRMKYEQNGYKQKWQELFHNLTKISQNEFLDALAILCRSRKKKEVISKYRQFRKLFEHYYPNGEPVACE